MTSKLIYLSYTRSVLSDVLCCFIVICHLSLISVCMYGARCQGPRNSPICLIPGEFCIEHCSTYGCCACITVILYVKMYFYMFTYDDVYNTLEPTLFAIPGELLY